METLQNEHLKILHQIAWNFSKRCNVDVDDLYGESVLQAVRKIDQFDASRGAISTFLNAVTYNHLVQYSMKQRTVLNTDFSEVSFNTPDQSILFLDKLNKLGSDAKLLCSKILNNPDVYSTINMSEITKTLREKNWSWPKIRKSYEEIRKVLK